MLIEKYPPQKELNKIAKGASIIFIEKAGGKVFNIYLSLVIVCFSRGKIFDPFFIFDMNKWEILGSSSKYLKSNTKYEKYR